MTARIDYDAIKAMNWSSLKLLYTSAKLFQHRLTNPQPEKREFELGTAAHCGILEPEAFEDRFGVYDGTHDSRHNAYKEWVAEHPRLAPLKQKDWDMARHVRDAVFANRDAAQLLSGGRAEETITWLDEASGLTCKARLDYVRPGGVVEVKTTVDISERRFLSQSAKLLYHGQAGYYHDGATLARAITAGAEYPYTIAVEKEPPYDVGVFQMVPFDMECGRDLCRYLLTRYTDCMAANWWPGKVPHVCKQGLPPWAPRGEKEEDFE